jgi:tetratricopeptide (TPR) repeat protein
MPGLENLSTNTGLPRSARKEFERAVALYNQGRLVTADDICTGLLARFPSDMELAHFGGVLANRMGRYEVAVQRLGACVRTEPRRARAQAALGLAEEKLDHFEDARRAFAAAIEVEPGFAEAHNGLGVTLMRMGQPLQAVACFERATALHPASIESRVNLARALQETGRGSAAAEHYREAARLAPARDDVLRLCAAGLFQAGDFEGSEQCYRALLAHDPDDALARAALALALWSNGRSDEAWREMRAALASSRPQAAVHNSHGAMLFRERRWEEAAEAFRRALALDPLLGEASVHLAVCLAAMGRIDEARDLMQSSEQGLDPPALAKLASLHAEVGESAKCIELAERAIASNPYLVAARRTLAVELLRTGRFEPGWREHVFRPTRGAEVVEQALRGEYPPALPSELRGREVTILAEQGLGDMLFFLRFAKPLADAGARLRLIGLDPRLEPLLARALDFEALPGREIAADALAVWAGDLPLFVQPLIGSEPCASLRIAPLAERLERMRERLGPGARPRVAFAWQAGVAAGTPGVRPDSLFKEISAERLGELLAGLPLDFVSVQRNATSEAMRDLQQALGARLVDCGDVNADLEDMLALLSLMDDYVGVSSTNVHLIAAAGHRARILVPYPRDWRWQGHGESVWYPGFTTYRQAVGGDWSEALAHLREDLAGARGP